MKSLHNSHLHIWAGAMFIVLFPVLSLFSETTPEVIIDLRADVNRDGVVDLTDPAEDENEDIWDSNQGAIFLPNIDDDQDVCSTDITLADDLLAACFDAADEAINGPEDLLDMARLRTVPWPDAPSDASATLELSVPASDFVRLFVLADGRWEVVEPDTVLSGAQLRGVVELALEGKGVAPPLGM